PTTSWGRAFNRIVRPMIFGSAPKRTRHNASDRIATRARSGSSSSRRNVRPAGATPSASRNPGETDSARTRCGSPSPDRLKGEAGLPTEHPRAEDHVLPDRIPDAHTSSNLLGNRRQPAPTCEPLPLKQAHEPERRPPDPDTGAQPARPGRERAVLLRQIAGHA